MSDPADMAERHGRILTELAELGLSLARGLHERALAAETPKDAAEMGLAFHRISRSVRQTLALEAKLERDRHRQEQADRIEAAREGPNRIAQRKIQLRAAVERAIWTEVEGDEAERLVDDLSDFLDDEALSGDFLEQPLDAHIAQIRVDLGLSPSAHPRDGGDPGRDATLQAQVVPDAARVLPVSEMNGTGDAVANGCDPDRTDRRSSG
jgi:hypothetical protein